MCKCDFHQLKLGQDYSLCRYCKEPFCLQHSHFDAYNEDTTMEELNGMKRCCNRTFCVSRFEHEKQIERRGVLNDFDKNPRKYFNANDINYLSTWLERTDSRRKIPRFANPYQGWV